MKLRRILVLAVAAAVTFWLAASVREHNSASGLPAGVDYVLNIKLYPKDLLKFTTILRDARKNQERGEAAKAWTEVVLQIGDAFYPAKVRLRGNVNNHWSREQISLRVALKKGRLLDGMSEFSLILPSDRLYLGEHLLGFWSNKMGMVEPRNRWAMVSINSRYQGIYLLQEELNKEFLERSARPDGPIYKTADSQFTPGSGYLNQQEFVYNLPFWNLKNLTEKQALGASSLLNELLGVFAKPKLTEDDYRHLSQFMDMEKIAAVNATARLLDAHIEVQHSYLLYFNPARGVFEPVMLDPSVSARKLDNFESANAAFTWNLFSWQLLQFDSFKTLRDRKLAELLPHRVEFMKYFDKQAAIFLSLVPKGRFYRAFPESYSQRRAHPLYAGKYLSDMRTTLSGNFDIIEQYLRNSPPKHVILTFPPREPMKVPLMHACAVRNALGYVVDMRVSPPETIANLEELTVKTTAQTAGLLRVDEGNLFLQQPRNQYRMLFSGQFKVREHEQLFVDTEGAEIAKFSLKVSSADGKPIPESRILTAVSDPQTLCLCRDLPGQCISAGSNIKAMVSGKKVVIPPGNYTVNKNIFVPSSYLLEFRPGVTLRFAEGVSFLTYSPVKIVGNASAPVRFLPLAKDRPWGAFAVMSTNKTAGVTNEVRWLVSSQGRGAELNGISFTGMLNFYESNLDISNSILHPASETEDTLNLKYSSHTIAGNIFYGTPSDALDGDWTSGLVSGNLFADIGADAVDFSGARNTVVESNVFFRTGDKGISAGENSLCAAEHNIFMGDVIGIAAKDLSEVTSSSNSFVYCKTVLAAYKKKEIFGGARLRSEQDCILNNNRITKKDSLSVIKLGEQRSSCQELAHDMPQTAEKLLYRLSRNNAAPPRFNAKRLLWLWKSFSERK